MPVRVTEPLNFFKEQWYIDWVHKVGRTEANKIAKASMKIGTEVDEIIKANPMGPLVMSHKKSEVANCLDAYWKWVQVYQPKSIVQGTRLFATIEGQEVTGEPDIFVDDVLVDIKCATKISPSYWIQVNMYKELQFINENLSDKAMRPTFKVGILRLDKLTGSYEYVVRDYEPHLVDVWCGLMRAMVYFKGEEDNGDEL